MIKEFQGQILEDMSVAPATPTIPHSREAEEAVIGSVLINPDSYYEVSAFLTSDDFYIHRHAWIWDAFIRLHEQRIPVDLLTVAEELDRDGKLMEIGGSAFLTALITQVPSSLNAESYARIVSGHAVRRKMITIANNIAAMAYKEDRPVIDLVDGSVAQIMAIQQHQTGDKHTATMGEASSLLYDYIDDVAKNGKPKSIATGLYQLDVKLHGLKNGKFYLVAGRPGKGKSSLLSTIAAYTASQNHAVGAFSLEMDIVEWASRLLAIRNSLQSFQIMDAKIKDDEWPILTHGIEEMSNWRGFIDDTPSITPERIYAKSRRAKQAGKLDLIVVDYIQIMGVSEKFGNQKNRNREQEVSHMARMLKWISRELDVPVLAAAQVNRMVETRSDKKLVLADLRESGSLEQEADAVMLLQPEVEGSSMRDVDIAKHRGGPVGTAQLIYKGEYTGFYNLTREDDRRNWWE